MLCSPQFPLDRFRQGLPLKTKAGVRCAERGGYFVESELTLRVTGSGVAPARAWIETVASGDAPACTLAGRGFAKEFQADIARGTEELWRIVAQPNSLQKTAGH